MALSCLKHLVLLVVVAAALQFTSADESNADESNGESNDESANESNDRIDTVIGLMVNMANRMDALESRVGDIARVDELTANKVTKLEDSVGMIHKEEGKIEDQIEEMKIHSKYRQLG